MKLSKSLSNSILLGSAVLAASLSAVAPAFAETNIYTWNDGTNLLNDEHTNDNRWLWDESDQELKFFENDEARDQYKNNIKENGHETGENFISVKNSVGYHKSITTSFDNVSNMLTWDSVFERNGNNTPNGGWLVLTEGPNPKHANENYAIFYMDGTSGRLSAFEHTTQAKKNSYQQNPFLGSWDNAVTIADNGTERTMSFSVDVSSILNTGIQTGFDDSVGIWFHATTGTNAGYDENGQLTSFAYSGKNWFDTEGAGLKTKVATKPTAAEVPEPATGLLGLGLIGWGTSSMKRRLASFKNRKA